jgi:hypothetical protein
MDSLDSLFPNKEDCYLALFQDAVYKHDSNIEYEFTDDGKFKRRDRVAVIRQVMDIVEYLFEVIKQKKDMFARCEPFVNHSTLMMVFTRYSRDIYGFRRIVSKLQNLGNGLTSEQKEQLRSIVLEGADFGFKIPSVNPYIHREIAVLLYWFSVLKPFNLNIKEGEGSIPHKNYLAYFNEYFSYHLINTAIHVKSVSLTLHTDKAYFLEFLNELHFRNLSRSSLEFFLPGFMS